MPRVAPSKLSVHGKDLENLRASGLTDATIRANELRTEYDSAKLADILNRGKGDYCCLGGLVFPYRDLMGNVNCFVRVRPHIPRMRAGALIKYEQPVGESPRAYFPATILAELHDGESSIYITDGEKKAIALSQLGLAVVGIGGTYCWKIKDTEDLIPDTITVFNRADEVYSDCVYTDEDGPRFSDCCWDTEGKALNAANEEIEDRSRA